MRAAVVGTLSACVLMLLGCGGPPSVDLVTVKGKLLKGGQPLVGRQVTPPGAPEGSGGYEGYQLSFFAGTQAEGSAQVDEKGEFTTELPPNQTYKVTITRINTAGVDPSGAGQNAQVAQELQKENEALKKFTSLQTTPVEIQVGDSDTEVTIDLDKY